MNAAEMTFGVEIETTMPSGAVFPGSHGCGRQVPWLPAGWLGDADPSIIPPAGRIGCEFVSPVLKGAEGLRQLVEVVKEIKRRGGEVNGSCGMHVHVGFDKSNTEALRKLLNLVANHEKGIYASTGTKNRERGVGSRTGQCWCRSLTQYGSARAGYRNVRSTRYHVLNVQTGGKPTIEVRAFGATLNPVKVVAYVRLCLGLVERSGVRKNPTYWKPRVKPNADTTTAGQREVRRLLVRLGWNANGESRKGAAGAVVGDGVPSMESSRAELIRLATKYDSMQ